MINNISTNENIVPTALLTLPSTNSSLRFAQWWEPTITPGMNDIFRPGLGDEDDC